MLVIRRRAGESFLIGDGIEVEVLEVGATQVKLGIAAPKDVSILRREVKITQQQNQAASREMSAAELATLTGRLRRRGDFSQIAPSRADKRSCSQKGRTR